MSLGVAREVSAADGPSDSRSASARSGLRSVGESRQDLESGVPRDNGEEGGVGGLDGGDRAYREPGALAGDPQAICASIDGV